MKATASNSSLPSASLISTQALMGIRYLELRARHRRSAELQPARRRSDPSASEVPTPCRVQLGDTAGCKPALQPMTAASNLFLPSASVTRPQTLMGIRNLELRAHRRRSAELHSAVSQVCNLRAVEVTRAFLMFQRPADCKSATRQIEDLRYFASPRHALLHRHSSGTRHRPATTGFLTV